MLYMSLHIAAVGPTEPVAAQVVSVMVPFGTLYSLHRELHRVLHDEPNRPLCQTDV